MVWTKPQAAAPAAAAPATAAAPAPAQHPVPPPAPLPAAPAAVVPAPAPVPPLPGAAAIQAAQGTPAATTLPPPAVAAPAPPAPAAAAPAAPAPSRRRGRPTVASTEATPPAAPAPVATHPGQQTLPVAQPGTPVTPAAVITPAATGLALPIPAGSYLAQLMANMSQPSESAAALGRWQDTMQAGGGEPNLFPMLTMTDSGLFDRDTMNVEGTDVDLPVGRDAWFGIFLGYRMTVLAWPKQAVRGGPKTQPLWKAVVGSDAPDAMDMVAAAVKEYQYTNKDRRSALFDGLCHPKAAVEILWYEGRIDNGRYLGDLICTRTTPTMEGCRVTIDNLMAALPRVRGQDGRDYPTLAPFVARVQPSDKIPMKSKTQDWEEYAISMSPMTTADSAETQQGFAGAKAAFDHWLQNGGYSAEIDAKIKKWNETTITQEQGDVLYNVSQARR
jgi:hypothetical protein